MRSPVANKDASDGASISQSETLRAITSLAHQRDDLAAVWLYGSRAREDHHPESDFDLAVAFTSWITDPLERRLRPELLAQEWQRELGLGEGMLSVVDLSIAPIPLGWSILSQGVLLADLDWDTRIRQESPILSRWEIDYLHQEGILPNGQQSAYLKAQRQHLEECEQDLAELGTLLEQRRWSRIERHAAERSLQLLIEACIGLAKHWVRHETGMACRDAITGFERLQDAGRIDSDTPWRKIIGLRNVLLHDYLDVDPEVVKSVIAHQHYRTMLAFGRRALTALEQAE